MSSTSSTLVLLDILGLATTTTTTATVTAALQTDDIRAQQAQIAAGIQARSGACQGLSAGDAEKLPARCSRWKRAAGRQLA